MSKGMLAVLFFVLVMLAAGIIALRSELVPENPDPRVFNTSPVTTMSDVRSINIQWPPEMFACQDGVAILKVGRKLYASAVDTGQTLWEFGEDICPVLVEDRKLFLGDQGQVQAIDAVSGTVLWRKPFDACDYLSPVIMDDAVLFCGSGGVIKVYEISTGETRWSYDAELDLEYPPVHSGECISILTGDSIITLDKAGNLKWKYDSPDPLEWMDAVGAIVLAMNDDNGLLAFDAEGALLFEKSSQWRPLTSGGSIYFVTVDGTIKMYDAGRQQTVWTHSFDEMLLTEPHLAGDYLICITADGTMHRLDRHDGKLLHSRHLWGDARSNWSRRFAEIVSNKEHVLLVAGSITALQIEDAEEVWTVKRGRPEKIHYLDDRVMIYRDTPERIMCIDAKTGETLWENTTGDRSKSIAFITTIDNGIVYYCSNRGVFLCLDTLSGQSRWELRPPNMDIRIDPVIMENHVAIASASTWFADIRFLPHESGEHNNVEASSGGSIDFMPHARKQNLYIVKDKRIIESLSLTGGGEWKHELSADVAVQPAGDKNHLYVPTAQGVIYKLTLDSGRVVWRVELGEPLSTTPFILADRVYVATDEGKLYALLSQDGQQEWEKSIADTKLLSLTSDGRLLYAGTESELQAICPESGDSLWSRKLDDELSSPLVADGKHLYFCLNSGGVVCLDAATGNERWNAATAGDRASAISVARDMLYVGDDAGTLRAFDAGTGAVGWMYSIGAPFITAPVVHNGKLYIGSLNGSLYIFH